MPELPEVETIRGYLRSGRADAPPVVGRRILASRLFWERTLAAPAPAVFQERIAGQVIADVGRRGKFLLLGLSEDTLIIHLRMSGDIVVSPASQPVAPHDRLVLSLEGDVQLAFNDTRKFGRAWLVADPQVVLGRLGPEPLSPALKPADFHAALLTRRRQLKPLLLDQTFLAGLGNIYTDEALHRARLHPLARAHTLSFQQADRLLHSIREVLQEGIAEHGASIDWVYRGGGFQNHFRVYRRSGQACVECGAPIVRIVVGQRSTHLCPACQPRLDRD